MAIKYEDIMLLMEQDKSIQEISITEGQYIFVGVKEKVDEPFYIAGIRFDEAITLEKRSELGLMDRETCLSIAEGFSKHENFEMPNEDVPFVHHQGDGFRIIIVDTPASTGMHITYRKFCLLNARLG